METTAKISTPQNLWERKILGALRLQMTKQTFESWVIDTFVIDVRDNVWVIGVKNSFAKEWLENRLITTISKTLGNHIDVPEAKLKIDFVVAEESKTPGAGEEDIPPVAPAVLGSSIPENLPAQSFPAKKPASFSGNGATAPANKRLLVPPTANGLAIDLRILNRTSYQPIPLYYSMFQYPYLDARYGIAGLRCAIFHQQESGLSRQLVQSENFTNWTDPVEYRLDDLAKRLGVSKQVLTGKYGYCQNFVEAKRAGQPRSTCCNGHAEREFDAGKHCKFWRYGILEIMSIEGWVRVLEMGGRKNYRILLQIWRSLPLLTPYKARFLSEAQQNEHLKWLADNQAKTGLSPEQWAAETSQDVIDNFPDRKVNLKCPDLFIRSPFRKGRED